MNTQQIFEAISSLIAISFTTVAGIVAKEVIRYIRTHQKEKLAAMAVKFAEETFKDIGGKQKFVKASEWLAGELHKVGIKNATSQEIQGLVQSAVKDMKKAFVQTERAHVVAKVEPGITISNSKSNAVEAQSPAPPAPVVTPKPEKAVADMTTSDLKQLVTQVIKEQAKPTPQPQ